MPQLAVIGLIITCFFVVVCFIFDKQAQGKGRSRQVAQNVHKNKNSLTSGVFREITRSSNNNSMEMGREGALAPFFPLQ